jgi:hypothetical protein
MLALAARHQLEEFTGQMTAAADAGRTEIDRILGGLGPLHELFGILRRMRRVDDQQQSARRHLRDGREIVHRVIRQFGNEGGIHRVLVVRDEQRVAVRRRFLDNLRTVDAGGAAAVIHDGLLFPYLRQMCGQQTGQKIRGATRCRRRDDANRAGRIRVRSLRWRHRQSQSQRNHQQWQFFTVISDLHCCFLRSIYIVLPPENTALWISLHP